MAANPLRVLNDTGKSEAFPCATCKSECCGSIPLTRKEYVTILRHLRTLPRSERSRLSAQRREANTCCFIDTEHWRCSIYEARPRICRLFGYAPRMTCQYAPLQATKMTNAEFDVQMTENAGESEGELGWVTGITLDWNRIKRDLIIGGHPKPSSGDLLEMEKIAEWGRLRAEARSKR